MSKNKRIFIVAGDPSADGHGARLIRRLKRFDSNLDFIGIGGPEMVDAGLLSIVSQKEVAVVGFWEVAKKYGFFKDLLKRCRGMLETGSIDLFVPIDYPGFNVRLATFAKKAGVPVAYYIAPQLWAWGDSRAKKLVGAVDKLLVVFPFEREFFSGFGLDVEFVGHPLLDRSDIPEKFPPIEKREKLIALFPGSRDQELKKHLPVFKKTAKLLKKKFPDFRFGVAFSRNAGRRISSKFVQSIPSCDAFDNPRELMTSARAGVVKTGTSTLEAALCGLPFVMIYKTSTLTYNIGKALVNTPYISLANILANKPIVEELVQGAAKPRTIARGVANLIFDEQKSSLLQNDFRRIRAELGGKGASQKAAKIIYNSFLKRKI